jgi:mRNA deadenylase 3'-5' endonuclease subunit Ccr4
MMGKKPIICLQEVSREWEGPFHVFFANRGYHLITSLSGPPHQGYMGVAMAIPLQQYEIQDVSIQRIADTKSIVPKAETLFYLDRFRAWCGVRQKKAVDPWMESLKRHNTMIATRLQMRESRKTFCIGTYHMPCAFWAPEVMLIHTSLAVKHLQEFAKGQEHIFAGHKVIRRDDFNFLPTSQSYELITENVIPLELNLSPLKTTLQSVYEKEVNVITNYAATGGKPYFAGVLDYIFISPGLQCTSVLALPSLDELKKQCASLPNTNEPSDHLLIGATITWIQQEQQ